MGDSIAPKVELYRLIIWIERMELGMYLGAKCESRPAT